MQQPYSKHLMFSMLLHVIALMVLVLSFEFSSTVPVIENSDKEVIDAVIVDAPPTLKKIIQKPIPEPPAPEPPKIEAVKPIEAKTPPPKKEDTIALPDKKQKKLKEDLIQKELLADMQKLQDKQKKSFNKKVYKLSLKKR